MKDETSETLQNLTDYIVKTVAVDAVYLYGSRAKDCAREDSDWDIAVIFTDYEQDLLERVVRPPTVESELERRFPDIAISIVDIREVPVPLQWNIIQGIKVYDRHVPAVRRLEHAIISAWEKDYER